MWLLSSGRSASKLLETGAVRGNWCPDHIWESNQLHLDFVMLHPCLLFIAKQQARLGTVIALSDFIRLSSQFQVVSQWWNLYPGEGVGVLEVEWIYQWREDEDCSDMHSAHISVPCVTSPVHGGRNGVTSCPRVPRHSSSRVCHGSHVRTSLPILWGVLWKFFFYCGTSASMWEMSSPNLLRSHCLWEVS